MITWAMNGINNIKFIMGVHIKIDNSILLGYNAASMGIGS
jgi:hypothetical protein